MRKTRTPFMLALAGLISSLITFVSPGTAVAAEFIPELKWPAVQVGSYSDSENSPQGAITLGCDAYNTPQDLVTFGPTGTETRRLARTQQIDGVANCIYNVAIDKDGDLYGSPDQGSNLLAYDGNTLKWKYPLGCTYYMANPVVGADGNVYAINNNGRLIGLTPEVEPGTTQPKKVMDVAASNARCDTELRALKNGLVTIRNLTATFYSYNGVNLGSPPSSTYVDSYEQISAEGRLFYGTYIESGGLRSANVSVYNPYRKEVTWTTTVSGNGAYVYAADPYATPDGGTLVVLREKKSVGGVFTNEQVYSLVKLNSMGIKVWSKTLPNQDVSGNTYGEPQVVIDQAGKIVLVRNGQLATNDPNNGSVDGISIAAFDSSGGVLYEQVMRGNIDKTSGAVYGYRTSYSGTNGPTVAPNTLFLIAKCTESCSNTNPKLYPIKVTGLGLDYLHSAVFNTTPRPATPYRAYGDSFSSGEGVEPFEAGTSTPNLNTCHRSDYAYPRLISGTSAKIPSLGSNGFRACSGAVTDNITDAPQWNEGTQLDLPVWPDNTTQLVTLTIGGNDIKFADFGKACVKTTCQVGSGAYNTSLNEINNILPNKLTATYERILKYAPNAKVYVLGYPQVMANKATNDPVDVRCPYMMLGGSSNWADAYAARDIVSKLNVKVQQKVDAVRAMNADFYQRLKYVPLDGANSPFNGHEVCGTGTSWFQNINEAAVDESYPFHPNQLGQVNGYAAVAADAINAG